jgi:hypothetical protein
MKKYAFLGLVLAVGVSMAFASSISVPWFSDNAPNDGNPLNLGGGTLTLVYLINTTPVDLTCAIEYFSQTGEALGPNSPDNTFNLSPNASVAFRPVAVNDQATEAGAGADVPDRPRDVDTKKNGSLKVSYVGAKGDVQGKAKTYAGSSASTMASEHLLGQ